MIFLESFLKYLRPHYDSDGMDRLNYYYTPMFLMIMSLMAASKQTVGDPIKCWIPHYFHYSWVKFSENYCYINGTYFIKPSESVADIKNEIGERQLLYYQWVAYILALQAICFYLPQMIWRCLNWTTGISVEMLMDTSKEVSNFSNGEMKEKCVKNIASHIWVSINIQEKMRRHASVSVYKGSLLTGIYLLVKILYLLQVAAQFCFLNRFLKTKDNYWGLEVLTDLLYGNEWEETGQFPRVAMCNFAVRVLGNIHNYTVQCVLMNNMWFEKFYMALWFYFPALFILTLLNIHKWVGLMAWIGERRNFIKPYVNVFNLCDYKNNERERRYFSQFVEKLGCDGILILRLISENAGHIVTAEIVADLWHKFLEDLQKQVIPVVDGDNNINEAQV